MSAAGARLFAQYAYPPNELGYCGPAGAAALLRPDDVAEVSRRARAFEGAWSYLEVLAGAAGTTDPLDAAVVEAYWLGGALVDDVDAVDLLAHLEDRFRGQPGGTWRGAGRTARAHHSFQVYAVYPWAALLRAGRTAGPAVEVLDRCRIRVGMVRTVEPDPADGTATVASRPLRWHDGVLIEGPEVEERVRWAVAGLSLIDPPAPGDLVALHWDWVCDVVRPPQAADVRERERSAIAAAGLGAGS